MLHQQVLFLTVVVFMLNHRQYTGICLMKLRHMLQAGLMTLFSLLMLPAGMSARAEVTADAPDTATSPTP